MTMWRKKRFWAALTLLVVMAGLLWADFTVADVDALVRAAETLMDWE